MDKDVDRTFWKIYRVPLVPSGAVVGLDVFEEPFDLERREAEVHVHPGHYFLLPVDGYPDEDVLAFFDSNLFKTKARETQRAYISDLRIHLNFLGSQRTTWRRATTSDLDDYEYWRCRDLRNPGTVEESKFGRELAAIRMFYEFQHARGAIKASPVLLKPYLSREGSMAWAPVLRSRVQAQNAVKWLTLRAYKEWRDVGIRMFASEGQSDQKARGRSSTRNAAFVELLWSSGLRIREGATLLLSELPAEKGDRLYYRSRLGRGVAKNGASRDFWLSREALRFIDTYIRYGRRLHIERAKRLGRYECLPGVIIVTEVHERGMATVRLDNGRYGKLRLDRLEEDERRRLFLETASGLEPLALWLGESGLPMRKSSWYAVFAAANARMFSVRGNTTAGRLQCHPHMLRHSFALRMLVSLSNAFEKRMALTPEERKEYRLLFGDPWLLVSQLLGHQSMATTRDTYLTPLKGLQLDLLLNDIPEWSSEVSDLITSIAQHSRTVHDILP